MDSGRTPLPAGTRIQIPHGGLYEITGDPIAFGGCSILYPAHRLVGETGQEQPDGVLYALKECFPATDHNSLRRSSGGIAPESPDPEAREYLHKVQSNMLRECQVVCAVFAAANYILPILEYAKAVTVTLPEQTPQHLENPIAVMHSVQKKGATLHEVMDSHIRLAPAVAFRILQRLLFALREIHRAGFLHLDISNSNIFLRGALDDGSEILTLMDLGSAREMTEGKTSPIVDEKDFFVSEVFYPPEVSRNCRQDLAQIGISLSVPEEGIRLGPEADLYQAACLLRYLLTGDITPSKDLLFCHEDQYLHPRKAARLKCSVTVTERIQRLLTKGLAPDPRARYQSADEMLQDVSAILDILCAKPMNLGAVEYDAFICYKHGPVDSVVARKLQRMLENYRAPKNKNFPRKPFRRVFVDEGELSSCADMGQEISRALKNSAHLIVLCSEDTPSSPWVNQEIDIFWQHHKNDHNAKILTVLTGGTPETSYPAALAKIGISPADQYSPHVQGRYAWQVMHKLRQGNFLKLVAPMLEGVNFEDLMQRRKVYRRRQAAAAAVCLSIAGSIFVSRSVLIARQAARIEEEHAAAQRNAALYLTEQARLRLEDEDRLGALELLLETPADQDLPQTQYQLSQALGAYISPNRSQGIYTDTGSILPAYDNFFLDPSGDYLFSWNAACEALDIWNARTLTPHCTVNVPLATVEQYIQRTADFSSLTFLLTPAQYACETSKDFLLPDSTTLIYRGRGQVSGLDYAAGVSRWTVSMDNTVTMAINESKTHLLVLSETDPTGLTAHLLEAETGRSLGNIPFSTDPGWVVSTGMQISDDLKWAAIPVQEADPANVYFPHHWLYLLDLETGQTRLLQLEEGQIGALRFMDGRLLMNHYDNYTFTMVNYSGTEISKVPDTEQTLSAWDPTSGVLLWEHKRPSYCWDSGEVGIRSVPYDTGSRTGRGALFYWDRFALLADPRTGEILHAYELPDTILEMKTGDNNWCATLRDGTEAMTSYDSEALCRNKLVNGTFTGARSQDRIFYLQREDGSIVRYEENRFDENYQAQGHLDSSFWELYDVQPRKKGYRLVLMDSFETAVLHTDEKDVLYHSVPGSYGLSLQSVLGTSEDGRLLYWYDTADDQSASTIYTLDLQNGQIEEYDLPLSDREVSWWNPLWLDSRIVYAAMEFTEGRQNQLTIYSWRPGGSRPKVLYRSSLSGELDAVQWDTFLADPENNACFVAISQVDQLRPNGLLRLDVCSKSVTEIPVDFLPERQNDDVESAILQSGAWHHGGYCWSSDGTLAVICFGDTAYCVDRQCKVQCQIPLNHPVVSSRICPNDDSLLLAEEDGTISRWRLPDGMWMGSIAMKDYCSTDTLSGSQFRWDFVGGSTLAVYTGSETLVLDLTDGALAVSACVKNAQLLDEADQFWILEPPDTGNLFSIGTFRRYSIDDLRNMAQNALS